MKEIREHQLIQSSQIQVNVLPTDTTITLGFAVTAADTTDYTVDSNDTITISDNETSGFTRLNILGDTDYEDNETIIVDITNVTGGDGATESGTQQRTVTIVNDDAQILVDVSTEPLQSRKVILDIKMLQSQQLKARVHHQIQLLLFQQQVFPRCRYIIRDTKLYERLWVGIKFNYNHRWFNNRFKIRVYGDEVDEDNETIYINVNVEWCWL